jgi:catechol 2,3-dioxygenase-like lactoylglutathione lyase family enzyme
MDITIQASFLPQDDPDAALAFYRDTLGFEVSTDVEYGGMHRITVGPAGQPYGVRDCAFRDPAGNLIRIQEHR